MNRIFGVIVFVALIFTIIAVFFPEIIESRLAFLFKESKQEQTAQQDQSTAEEEGGGAAIGGEFSLIDSNAKEFSSKQLLGKPSLIYFGFTSCPDVCPTDVAILSNVLSSLGSDAEKVNVVFISIDPKHDKPEVLKTYLSNFNKAIIGLTGDEKQIKDVESAFKVYSEEVKSKDSSAGYTVNHSAFTYLMDKDGKYYSHFAHDSKVDEIVSKLKEIL